MMTAPTLSPSELEAREPRYRAMLEAERERWWDSGNFDKWRDHYIDEYYRGRFVAELLAEHAPGFRLPGARVLDVGCGDAGVPLALATLGAHAAGIEPNAASVERGEVRSREHGVSLDLRGGVAEALPFDEDAFDLVILDNVLEHVQDRELALREVRRVLRPGGLFYVVTPKPLALHSIVSDPHYGLTGLVLMPRPLQKLYFEKLRGGGSESFSVGHIPTRAWLRRRLRRLGFRPLVSPRTLWIEYVRMKLRRARLSSPLKRRVGEWLAERPEALDSAGVRWALDVSFGSNLFLCRLD